MGLISRVTMFKVPDKGDQLTLIKAFDVLEMEQKKDGKPYIIGVHARRMLADPRSSGYTVMVYMTFACIEDMRYFDEECPAHMEVKEIAQGLMSEKPLVAVSVRTYS